MKTLSYRLSIPFLICLIVLTACHNDDNPINNIGNGDTPTVSKFTPQSAFVGDTITIEGTNLDDNLLELSIVFGKTHATVIKSSETLAQVVVPDDIEEATVKIQFTSFKGALINVGDFKLKAPVIDSFTPASGYAGQKITIKGKGFRKGSAIKQVKFGDKVVDATVISRSELTTSAPEGTAVGDYPVSVTIAGLTATHPELFHVVTATLTSFSPESAFIGDIVTLTGRGFGTDPDALSIQFGNVRATVMATDETTATVIVPDDLEASETDIRFFVPGNLEFIASKKFTVKAPVIESISPTFGLPGQSISIKGKGFRNSYHFPQIVFGSNSIAANVVNPIDNTEIIMHVPSKSVTGTYDVAVEVLGMTATASEKFEVIVPTVTSFTPESGDEFTTVTITGTNLIDPHGGNTGVAFSDWKTGLNSRGAYILSHSATQITVDVPHLQKGTWNIRILVLGATVTLPEPFTYTGED